MCGLCGVLGTESHWTDSPETAQAGDSSERRYGRRLERLERVRICNRILAFYGLSLSDWQASAYILRSRTGRSQIVPHLAAIWPPAESMAGRPCDPLDPEIIAALEAEA